MPPRTTGDVASLLERARNNDRSAIDALFELLYDDLRRIAHSRLAASGHQTLLNTSALVHEAYLRFQQADRITLKDREHFLAYAASTLRSVVVDFVRKRGAERRGGDAIHVTLDTDVADHLVRATTRFWRYTKRWMSWPRSNHGWSEWSRCATSPASPRARSQPRWASPIAPCGATGKRRAFC